MDQALKRTRNSWQAMRDRCTNPKTGSFHKYGAKGIKVCDRWLNSFTAFVADMGLRPEGKTLDRWPNSTGDYEPGNCRWATPKQQAENSRSRGVMLTFEGRTQSINAWTKELGFSVNTVQNRIRAGWSVESALTTAPRVTKTRLLTHDGRTQSINAWTRELNLGKNTINRWLRAGKSVPEVLTRAGA